MILLAVSQISSPNIENSLTFDCDTVCSVVEFMNKPSNTQSILFLEPQFKLRQL